MEFKSEKVRQIRLRMGWSQSDLARRLQTDVQVIAGIEDGQTIISEDLKSHFVFLLHQAEILSEQIQCIPLAEQLLDIEGLPQIFHSELQDKIIHTEILDLENTKTESDKKDNPIKSH